jgi:hypothetical protein
MFDRPFGNQKQLESVLDRSEEHHPQNLLLALHLDRLCPDGPDIMRPRSSRQTLLSLAGTDVLFSRVLHSKTAKADYASKLEH